MSVFHATFRLFSRNVDCVRLKRVRKVLVYIYMYIYFPFRLSLPGTKLLASGWGRKVRYSAGVEVGKRVSGQGAVNLK